MAQAIVLKTKRAKKARWRLSFPKISIMSWRQLNTELRQKEQTARSDQAFSIRGPHPRSGGFLVMLRFFWRGLSFAPTLRFQALLQHRHEIDHLRRRLFLFRLLFDFLPARFDLLLDYFHQRFAVIILVFLGVPF